MSILHCINYIIQDILSDAEFSCQKTGIWDNQTILAWEGYCLKMNGLEIHGQPNFLDFPEWLKKECETRYFRDYQGEQRHLARQHVNARIKQSNSRIQQQRLQEYRKALATVNHRIEQDLRYSEKMRLAGRMPKLPLRKNNTIRVR